MSIKLELEKVQLTDDEYKKLRDTMYDVQTLADELRRCETPHQVVRLLHVALLDGARPYFIPRIYGRYRKLTQLQDYEDMHVWAHTARTRG